MKHSYVKTDVTHFVKPASQCEYSVHSFLDYRGEAHEMLVKLPPACVIYCLQELLTQPQFNRAINPVRTHHRSHQITIKELNESQSPSMQIVTQIYLINRCRMLFQLSVRIIYPLKIPAMILCPFPACCSCITFLQVIILMVPPLVSTSCV